MSPVWILLGLIVVLFTVVISLYNNLVALRNRFKNAFAQIDVQLKRRHDLIPNLVETAKAYLKHEKETLEAVIQARNQASTAAKKAASNPADGDAVKSLMGAESMLSGTLGKFFALAESYPDLKANQNMAQLSEELSSTENKIAFARQGYNDAVMTYNTACEQFPGSIIAGSFNFKHAEMFEIENEAEKAVPKVSFG